MTERFLYSSHDENHDGSHPWKFCKLMSELPWPSYGHCHGRLLYVPLCWIFANPITYLLVHVHLSSFAVSHEPSLRTYTRYTWNIYTIHFLITTEFTLSLT